MKFLILSENCRSHYLFYHYRNPAANELRKRIVDAGHEALIIEWITHWDKKDLYKVIDSYFVDEPNPILAISNTFDLENQDLIYLEDIFKYSKEKYPNLKIIHGGARWFLPEKYRGYIDVEFLGRSMGIFEDWINNRDISKYKIYDTPLVLINKHVDVNIDTPITPTIFDDDLLTHHDHLGFEIGIGCRFNCSFCNYDLRNSKTVHLNDPKKLHDFFYKAYNDHGVKHFYCIDDTLNESIEKLEILREATANLNYHPKITAWMRADLLNNTRQRELIKEINFDAIWFGIESFNPNVSKNIRKKSAMSNVFDSLIYLRDNCPDTFTMGSFIIGLNGDSAEEIERNFDKVVAEKLLHSMHLYVLTFWPVTDYQDVSNSASDIEKDPKKFGYNLRHDVYDPKVVSTTVVWESDWTNSVEANKLANYFYKKYEGQILFVRHSECSAFRAMGLLQPGQIVDMTKTKHSATILSNLYKKQYISSKKKQLGLS